MQGILPLLLLIKICLNDQLFANAQYNDPSYSQQQRQQSGQLPHNDGYQPLSKQLIDSLNSFGSNVRSYAQQFGGYIDQNVRQIGSQSQSVQGNQFNGQRYKQEFRDQATNGQTDGEQVNGVQQTRWNLNRQYGSSFYANGRMSQGQRLNEQTLSDAQNFVHTDHMTNMQAVTSGQCMTKVKLMAFSNPSFSLPSGMTCSCPPGKHCTLSTHGSSSGCNFAFTTIIIYPDESVNYITTEFIPSPSGSVSGKEFPEETTVYGFAKPASINVFVHHLGVVVDRATGTIQDCSYLVLVDTFVNSLRDYVAAPKGVTPNNVVRMLTGKSLNTTLQIGYSASCVGIQVGPNCDLICDKTDVDSMQAACKSVITGGYYSCRFDSALSTSVSNCQYCEYGLTENRTACAAGIIHDNICPVGLVSSAYRIWTIVLGSLLGLACLFILFLTLLYLLSQKKLKERENQQRRQNEGGFQSQRTVAASQGVSQTGREAYQRRGATIDRDETANERFRTGRTKSSDDYQAGRMNGVSGGVRATREGTGTYQTSGSSGGGFQTRGISGDTYGARDVGIGDFSSRGLADGEYQTRAVTTSYESESKMPLISQHDDEWSTERRVKSVRTIESYQGSAHYGETEFAPSYEDSFSRGSTLKASKKEAQV
ncbi:hypothetical protein AB6A40_005837 [Gnathostoma spinigerum]|uniref:Uncharacterized protein n=1 Tax=Gnathostoma spinigerum TaxID=75299 RepID=A0ABD6EGS5_9BILA